MLNPLPDAIVRSVTTPAYVFDRAEMRANILRLRELVGEQVRILAALKAFTFVPCLRELAPLLDGFAASSLFEARLARELLGARGCVHLTAPGWPAADDVPLAEGCDVIACNSLGQFARLHAIPGRRAEPDLRLNPGFSPVRDRRYNPCMPDSKLGIPLPDARRFLDAGGPAGDVRGIHFHSNCEGEDLADLARTVDTVLESLGPHASRLRRINLGGGYLYAEADHRDAFRRTVRRLQVDLDAEVFIEPGFAVSSDAGFLVASVVDRFRRGGKEIAVLDTAVNHLPEVLEFGIAPEIAGTTATGEECELAGCTCLAGDVFGTYRFRQLPEVGERVVFTYAGSYGPVKANRFNGVNLPGAWVFDGDPGTLRCEAVHTYEEFAARHGAR